MKQHKVVLSKPPATNQRRSQSETEAQQPNPIITSLDVNNSNLYCKVCDKKFKLEGDFNYHLGRRHNIKATGTRSKGLQSYTTIDRNHPELYCSKCEHY